MKKIYVGIMTMLVAVSLLGLTACKVTPDQVKAIANAVGLFSAVTWIAIDNPPQVAKTAVIEILGVIADKASSVKAGQTYTEVLYPELVKIIDADVPVQYRPLCKAGTAMLLGQLDLLFAAHPDWKQDQDIALDVTIEFCKGAEQGLSLAETDLIIIQAKRNSVMRANVRK